jgi:hypothetical protein
MVVKVPTLSLALALLITACSSGIPESSITKPVGTTVTPALLAPGGTSSDQPDQPVVRSFSDETSIELADSTPYELPEELKFTATLIGGQQLDGTSLASRDVLFWFWTPT